MVSSLIKLFYMNPPAAEFQAFTIFLTLLLNALLMICCCPFGSLNGLHVYDMYALWSSRIV